MEKVGITAVAAGAFATVTQVADSVEALVATAIIAVASAGFLVARDVLRRSGS